MSFLTVAACLDAGRWKKNTCPGTLPGDDDGRAVITDTLLVLFWLQKGPTIFWTNDGNLFFFGSGGEFYGTPGKEKQEMVRRRRRRRRKSP